MTAGWAEGCVIRRNRRLRDGQADDTSLARLAGASLPRHRNGQRLLAFREQRFITIYNEKPPPEHSAKNGELLPQTEYLSTGSL